MDFIFQCLAFCDFGVVKKSFTAVAQSFLYLYHKIAIKEIIYSTEFFSDILLCSFPQPVEFLFRSSQVCSREPRINRERR